VAPDAPLGDGWLLQAMGGEFLLLALGAPAPEGTGLPVLAPEITDPIRARYLGDQEQALYLIRPDQVVGARWVSATAKDIRTALAAAQEGRT
jgi:3-(3-hydroxy-phenyl)propionate hydroxylase